MIRLHNTLTGTLDEFIPQQEGKVTLYTCGPTVYSEPHVGNWAANIRWDLLVRVLKANNYDVERVMNITDVGHLVSDADNGEDKMQKGAKREGITAWEVAQRYTDIFKEGMKRLSFVLPEVLPRATDHISEQIELVKTLEKKGHTYIIDDGVYFDTTTFPSYASFARLDLTAMKAGARVEFNDQKRNHSDFALWKFSPLNEKRDMEWDSPWGKGFPGWHIECSAMAMKYLGETLDIHTGGIDHIPVHHTNEIAQSEAATAKPFSNYWLHTNFLLADGTKISKSIGNVYTLNDIERKGYSIMAFKLFVLQSHYRSETNFTWEQLDASTSRLTRWRTVAVLRHQTHATSDGLGENDANTKMLAAKHIVLEALNNDLSSPLALSYIDSAFDVLEQAPSGSLDHTTLVEFLTFIDEVLGLDLLLTTPDIPDELKQKILERSRAREQGNWSASDKLRDQLAAENITLLDTATGTRWYYTH